MYSQIKRQTIPITPLKMKIFFQIIASQEPHQKAQNNQQLKIHMLREQEKEKYAHLNGKEIR